MGRPPKYVKSTYVGLRCEEVYKIAARDLGVLDTDMYRKGVSDTVQELLEAGRLDPTRPSIKALLEIRDAPIKKLLDHKNGTNQVLQELNHPVIRTDPIEQSLPVEVEKEEEYIPTDLERLALELPLTDDERLRYHRAVQTYLGHNPGGSRYKTMSKACKDILETEFAGHDFEEYQDLPGTFYDLICGDPIMDTEEDEDDCSDYSMNDTDIESEA